jgi:PAS domain S-box-containing protein
MNSQEIHKWKRELAQEKASRKSAEKVLEKKSAEIIEVNRKLEASHKELLSLYDKTHSQLQGVFENIVDAYVIMDLNGNILKMNDAAVNLLEFDSAYDERNLTTLVDPSDASKVIPSFKKLLKNGSITNFIIKILTAKGRGKSVHINASIIYEDKIAVGAQGIIRDITSDIEKVFVIETLNNVAKAILGKVDILEIASVITSHITQYLNTEDCVIYVLDEKRQMLEQIEAYGNKVNKFNEIKNKIEIPVGQGIVGSVVKTGKSEIIKDTSKDDRYIVDDDVRYSEITVPIISEGKVIGVIDSEHRSKDYFTNEQLLMLENIGSLIAMKIKSAINFRERQKVELKNIKLLKELEKSNEALQEYAHVVSHDLKSPLRSINALISWIQEDNKNAFDASSLENFSLIEMTLERMEQLISDILSYSSIGSDGLEKQEIDVNQVVLDLKKILFIPSHIKVKIQNKLPVVIGERAKIQQLFQNLISNAIKFNDKKRGLVEVDVSEKKSFYQFSIKDNGPGIEKKYHDKIFKIFHSLNKNNSSSGIGLAVVKKIVDLFNGEIWLESKLNEGATFYFTLKK